MIEIDRNKFWREYNKRRREADPRWALWKSTRNTARRQGLEHTLSLDDILIPETCPVLGIQIVYTVGQGKGPRDYLPSIDRIDPKLGYIKSNCRVISYRANRLKSDLDRETLLKILSYLDNCSCN